MFDVSFSELMLIGVIALIVIGPERLPKVARTIGHLIGRAQRYVSDVKSDIQQEMDLKDIGDLKGQIQDAARSVKDSMSEVQSTVESSVSAPIDEAKKALQDAQDLVKPTTDDPPATDSDVSTRPDLPAAPDVPAPPPADANPPDPVQAASPAPAPARAPAEPVPATPSTDKPA
ncbi:MAG: Sec-independent protein translocase protein TatB [Alcaligenaceae bacterium]|nr:Sec-independent protein translocase protein TatB [Alcaligenaceae bacterium]